MNESLTTFGDLYREALPEERRELIRLRVNQLIWTPDEIRFTLLDQPEACQELVESQQLVAQRLDSLNHPASGISSIYQGHRRNTAFIGMGRRHRPRRLKIDKHPNALKQALHYRELLESGQADSQGELSRLCGTPRTTISAYLRLLGLDEEVRAEALNLSDEDERVARLTEPRLRHLVGLQPAEQLRQLKRKPDGSRRIVLAYMSIVASADPDRTVHGGHRKLGSTVTQHHPVCAAATRAPRYGEASSSRGRR